MKRTQKLEIFHDLMHLNQILENTIRYKSESLFHFGNRVSDILNAYIKTGERAQNKLNEVMENAYERERIAIKTYIRCLSPEIKRYMCNSSFYLGLFHVKRHAEMIDQHLIDIENLTPIALLTLMKND